MRELLQLHLRDEQYNDMLMRYHFGEHDLEQLRQVGSLVEKAAEPVMYYGAYTQGAADGGVQSDILSEGCMAVAVTLGGGVDELQNRYMQRERLSESYMTECIGMELLRVAYEQAAERIHAHTGKWISGFEFVGDQISFDCMEEIFLKLSPEEVSYNQAYMLTPKKTAVFLTDLCDERKDSYCQICAGCGNAACSNRTTDSGYHTENSESKNNSEGSEVGRNTVELDSKFRRAGIKQNLTYGYQIIFGKKDENDCNI